MNTLRDIDVAKASRRIVASLFAVQGLATAAIIAMATVLSIVAVDLTGNPSLAGVPNTVVQLAGAVAALFWGRLWDRLGRKGGLSLALLLGLAGVTLSAVAVEAQVTWILGIGILGIGAARAGAQLARFIAAEVTPAERRGSAISLVVWGGTIGAVAGPLLVGPSSRAAVNVGMDALTGPVAVAVPLMMLAMVVAYLGLRPEPLEISRRIESSAPGAGLPEIPARGFATLVRSPGVVVAVVTVVLSQAVMIMVMTITSLHMRDIGHSLGDISLVFSAHTLGMFAFAPLSGRLADRIGRGPVMLSGGLVTILSAIVAPSSPSVAALVVGLLLLGLGWNLCFVAGSALLSDQLNPAERSRTQGANDLLIGLASGLGSLSSGVVYAALGYGTVNQIGAVFMAVAVGLSGWWLIGGRRTAPITAGDSPPFRGRAGRAGSSGARST